MKLQAKQEQKLTVLKSDGELLHQSLKTLKLKLNQHVLACKTTQLSKVNSMLWGFLKEDLLPDILLKDAQLRDQ